MTTLARQIGALAHEVRLIAPIYVKSFVKRNKNDAADAEAIGEDAGSCAASSSTWLIPRPFRQV